MEVDDEQWIEEVMEKTNEEQSKTKHCPGEGYLGEGCPGEGDMEEGPGFMWGNKETWEIMRKRKTVKWRKSNKIKEMTAGEVRHLILEKNDMRELKKTKQEGKMMVKRGKIKYLTRCFRLIIVGVMN